MPNNLKNNPMKKMRIMTVATVIALAIPFFGNAQTAKATTTTKTPASTSQTVTTEKQKPASTTTSSTSTTTSSASTNTQTQAKTNSKPAVHKMPKNSTAKRAQAQPKSTARSYHASKFSELKKKHKKGEHHTHHTATKKAPSGNGK
jgi:hypothetical protein